MIREWLSEPLSSEVRAVLKRLEQTESVREIAVMPDVHLAEDVCIGTVIAADALLFPAAVGGDIGCGMACVAFDCEADRLADELVAGQVLRGLYRSVPVMRQGGSGMVDRLPDVLGQSALSDPRLDRLAQRDGRVQLGTLGRGNHFLELQEDEDGRLWLMVHSGSRAMGQAITQHHLGRARRTGTGLKCLDADGAEGAAYLADVQWARTYARLSRRFMVDAVIRVLNNLLGIGPLEASCVDCDHNHVYRERHFGEDLWVHRKGAISAMDGEAGIIPGSMGTASYHAEGRGHPDSLCSSSHGAGRAMNRSEARRRISSRELERQLRGVWFDHRAAVRLCEEAPSAYKDIDAVMRAQKELTRIVRRLRPVLCYKGT